MATLEGYRKYTDSLAQEAQQQQELQESSLVAQLQEQVVQDLPEDTSFQGQLQFLIERDFKQPASTRVARMDLPTQATIGQRDIEGPSTVDVLGREVAGALSRTIGSPLVPGIDAVTDLNQLLRTRQTPAQNLLADVVGFLPYVGPQAPILIGKDILKHPTLPIDILKQSGKATENILAATGTLEPLLELASLYQKGQGLGPTGFEVLPKNLQKSIIKAAEIFGVKALRESPFGVPFAAALPAMIVGGFAGKTITGVTKIKTGFKTAEQIAKGTEFKPVKELPVKISPLEKPTIAEKLEVVKEPVAEFRNTELTPKLVDRAVVKDAKVVSNATNEIIQKAKAPLKVQKGMEKATKSMIEHDRQIRRSESTSALLKKTVKDAVPDKNRQMLMVHAYEHKMKGKFWKQLNDSEKAMVRWAANEKQKLNKYIKENDILDLMDSPDVNHIFHHWIDPKTNKPFKAVYGKFSKGLPQSKQRTIPTYEKGIEQGLMPATTNLGELIGLEWQSATRANQSRQMFKTLSSTKVDDGVGIQLRKGKPPKPIRMIERWDLLNKQGLTDDYIRYSHPSLDKKLSFIDAEGIRVQLKGAVGVRKELYPKLRAYMENPNYVTYDKLNFASKSLTLSNPVFHPIMLGFQEVANWRIPFSNIPRGLKLRKELSEPVRLLHQEGLELFKGYEDLGYQNTFFEGVNLGGKIGNFVTWPITIMRDWVFKVVQPGMKTSFAVDKYHRYLPDAIKRFGDTPLARQEAARRAVMKADGHFSGEHYKRSLLETNNFMIKLYFMPEARKWWQRSLLSPTWQREHMLVAKNVAKSFMPDRMIKKLGLREMLPIEKTDYRRYALSAVLMVGAVDMYNMMYTKTMDGEAKHIWQNPPGKGFGVRAPWNEPSYEVETNKLDKDGNPIMRTVPGGPAYIRPLKSIYEVAEWFRDPFKKFSFKLAPAVTAIGTQIFPSKYRREYKGIEDIPRRMLDFIIDVGTPITADQLASVARGKRTLKAGVLSSAGFPTSKLGSAETKKLYYKRMAKAGRGTREFIRLKNEFEALGFKFSKTEFKKHK